MDALLQVDHLSKTFRGNWLFDSTRALADVTLEVRAGETVGLLGPNGAGKTTTFKAIAGLIRPSGGRVLLFGLPPRRREARARLGFLPENPYFYDFLSGEEVVDLAARLVGVPRAERPARVAASLDRAGLGDARRRLLRTYSKGMKQRVGIAQALVGGPELVLLDEPMTGLDPIGRREVRDLIGGLADERTGVLFSTHVLQDVELTCDRVVILAEGRIRREGTLEELVAGLPSTVEVTVRGLPAASADAAAQAVGAQRLGGAGGRLVYRAPDPAAAERLRAAVVERGGAVTAIDPQPPRLEDAFLETVGRPEAAP